MFIYSRIRDNFSLGATDGSIVDLLPTNPLSAIFIHMRCLTAAASVDDSPIGLLAQLLNIVIRHRGVQLWAASGDDIARVVASMGIYRSRFEAYASADNSRRSISICIPFGRQLFGGVEALPRTQKGELDMQIDYDAVTASYDGIGLTIEALELPDATPQRFIRCTTSRDTPAATGNKDYDLPRAFPLVALGIQATSSYPSGATPTISSIKILRSNQDTAYTEISVDGARALNAVRGSLDLGTASLSVRENEAGAYTQNAQSGTQLLINTLHEGFSWLPFDVLGDGQYLLDGPNSTDLKARINFGAAEAIRLLPVELVPVQALLPGPAASIRSPR